MRCEKCQDWTMGECPIHGKVHIQRHTKEAQLAATTGPAAIVILAEIKGNPARILLDSGASENFIGEDFISEHSIMTPGTGMIRTIFGVDGKAIHQGPVKAAGEVPLQSGNYETRMNFRVTTIQKRYYDAVIGIIWFDKTPNNRLEDRTSVSQETTTGNKTD
jgi:hypothetical protein